MQLAELKKSFKNYLNCILAWFSDLFSENPSDRPKQLIPVRNDNKKSIYNHRNDSYELKVLKMMLLIVTTLLLILTGMNLVFE